MRDARLRVSREGELAEKPPVNESWWPSYTAWQAFAVKVLVEGGRNQDSNLTRLYGYRDRMPVFALAYLHDALAARGNRAETPARLADLRRRIVERHPARGRPAHVEELSDPYLLWFWNSNVRSTAIVLGTLVRAGADAVRDHADRPLADERAARRALGQHAGERARDGVAGRLLPQVRERRPDLRGGGDAWRRRNWRASEFRGRSTEARRPSCRWPAGREGRRPGTTQPLTFAKQGRGHALLHDAAPLRVGSAVPRMAWTTASASRAATRPTSRTAPARRRRASRRAIWSASR